MIIIESLERNIAVEIDATTIGIEAELVVAAEGGGQCDCDHARRNVAGIDNDAIVINDAESVVRMLVFK